MLSNITGFTSVRALIRFMTTRFFDIRQDEEAVDLKIEEQRKFVAWWKASVRYIGR